MARRAPTGPYIDTQEGKHQLWWLEDSMTMGIRAIADPLGGLMPWKMRPCPHSFDPIRSLSPQKVRLRLLELGW